MSTWKITVRKTVGSQQFVDGRLSSDNKKKSEIVYNTANLLPVSE
jgi:hypothetical protein